MRNGFLKNIIVTRIGEIAHVELNRPKKRNAMSFELLKELIQIAEEIKNDQSIRVVILSGNNNIFSTGIDLNDLNSPQKRAFLIWESLKPGQSIFQKANLIWQSLPIPVIAALNGYCFGAGLQLALGADIRICHPNCQLSIMETRWGLIPDMGLTHSLKGIITSDITKELTMTGRIFNGEYAKSIGLVTHLNNDPNAEAIALATELLQRSPDALLASKRILNAMIHQPNKSLRLEKIWQLKLLFGYNSKIARIKDKNSNISYRLRQFK